MGEKCILKRDFIFDADNQKAFQKLRDHQFPRMEQGIVYEPLANALDQQQGDTPVSITAEKSGNCYVLTYHDNGPGLTPDNLEALHFIGKSTKRKDLNDYIGRFGMGLTGAFHSGLGIKKVEIRTRVCGVPSRVIYRCNGDAIPTWFREDTRAPCRGMSISFFVPKKRMETVFSTLENLLDKTIVPILYNGKIYHHPPEEMERTDRDIFLVKKGDPQIFYCAHITEDPSTFRSMDPIRIYLRGMPVEEDDMYRIFVTRYGDKMPQNYSGKPYMKHESGIVLSGRAEPTVGRDKVVRNKAFEDIQKAVETLRAEALRDLFKKGLAEDADEEIRRYAQDMAAANLYSLSSQLVSRIKGETLSEEKAYLAPLLDDLLDYPLFPSFGSQQPLAAREIVRAETPGDVFFYAKHQEARDFLTGRHKSPFILREQAYFFSGLWGGHEKHLIDSLLKPLVESRAGAEIILLEDLMWDEARIEDLEKRKVIHMHPMRIRITENPDGDFTDFLDRLRETLNRPWFREAVSRFHPPKRVHIKPIEVLEEPTMGDTVAGVLSSTKNREELAIGLNVTSATLRGLVHHPNGHFAFLPILCHELSHRRRTVVGDGEDVPHGQGFYFDRVRMEERVLAGCARYLLGKEMAGGIDGGDGAAEMLVL